jgi:membrane-bound serine protease (ClpP class)
VLMAVGDSATEIKPGADRYVTSIAVTEAIGPATPQYVRDTLLAANPQHAEAVILRLNTPGGLATSMREIIADVLASPVPVIGFVAPAGAHAASAGTYSCMRPMWPPWPRAPTWAPRLRCRSAARLHLPPGAREEQGRR